MYRFLLCTTLLILGYSLYAQQYEAPLLIPYNDHGEWGFCDTLGNIQIDPAYEKATFFFPFSLAKERIAVSRVQTKDGRNLLQTKGELLFPAQLDYHGSINSTIAPNTLFILKRKDKYGIYEQDKGWLIRPVYDTLAHRFSFSKWFLFKRDKADTYDRFSADNHSMEATDIVDVGIYFHKYNVVEVVTKRDSSRYEIRDDKLVLIDPEEFSQYEDMGDTMLEEVPDDDYGNVYRWQGAKPTAEELGVDRTLVFKDYSGLGFGDKYGFTKIIIAEKAGQTGVLTEKGEELLPFAYDQIRMVEGNTQLELKKDGKIGRKILFTHHPMIAPKYDKLRLVKQLRVTPRWSFAIFGVSLNGQKGFVGENAVEYFDFE